MLDPEEYIEQVYFFRAFRERLTQNLPAQEILQAVHEEILTTTRLPLAIQYLATEVKHSGLLANGFARLGHYFTPFQAFVIRQAEQEGLRFTVPVALLVLEREAEYKSKQPTRPGLFVYQFETLCRNRLGYLDGLHAMAGDPMYGEDWRKYLTFVAKQVGAIEFADLVYIRSSLYVADERMSEPGYEPPVPPLFAEKEGKIAKASRGRDPLFLFAALQRQLGYPEVPRQRARNELQTQLEAMRQQIRELENRVKLLEGEVAGGPIDWGEFGLPEKPPAAE